MIKYSKLRLKKLSKKRLQIWNNNVSIKKIGKRGFGKSWRKSFYELSGGYTQANDLMKSVVVHLW